VKTKTVKFYDVFALALLLSDGNGHKVRGVFLNGRFFYGVLLVGGEMTGALVLQSDVEEAVEIAACDTDPDNFPRSENSTLSTSPVFDDDGAFMGVVVECSQRKSC
jgi:hypothetical protein